MLKCPHKKEVCSNTVNSLHETVKDDYDSRLSELRRRANVVVCQDEAYPSLTAERPTIVEVDDDDVSEIESSELLDLIYIDSAAICK